MKKSAYFCQECGTQSPKWMGRCPGCERWNTFVEETNAGALDSDKAPLAHQGLRDAFKKNENLQTRRWSTGIEEMDRVLGGGLVSDSFVLLGGEPGIGKSTLLLQMAGGLLKKEPDCRVMIVSGEESISQIQSRAERLGVPKSNTLFIEAEIQLEAVFKLVKTVKPNVLVLDSLQTFMTVALESAPGSVSQLREVSARLMNFAKSSGTAVIMVGHVTKDGQIAGPKAVEHIVDTVLYFEGEGMQSYRLLRAVKNRFGSSRELGVFEMDEEGLKEVKNPSAFFLTDRDETNLPTGVAVSSTLEGSRTLLVEFQALTVPVHYGIPRRTAVGIDSARLALMAAILEKHLKAPLAQTDLFFNVAGGLRVNEPSCDLGIAVAVLSSIEGFVVNPRWIFLGEVGLTGEVRRPSHTKARLSEATKLGFKKAIVGRGALKDFTPGKIGCDVVEVGHLKELTTVLQDR